MRGSTIRLQAAGARGEVLSSEFRRSSQSEFQKLADDLKAKAEGQVIDSALQTRARQMRQAVQNAEKWISNAELHARRIPGVKAQYQKMEEEMRSLVARERSTTNSVARGQISVRVSQYDVAGSQADIQVDQTWDGGVGGVGRSLRNEFAGYPSDCGNRQKLLKSGATIPSIEVWEGACKQALAERARFEQVFTRIMGQRSELKGFQTAAEARRRALVSESDRIQ